MVAFAAATVPEATSTEVASGVFGNRTILTGISWGTYERLLVDFADRSAPRFAYDRGVLEIMSPRKPLEESNRTLADVVTVVSAGLGIDVANVGSTTYRRRLLEKGFEADTAFYVQRAAEVSAKIDIDADIDPPPDLVIESDLTNPSLPKLPLYAAFGVPEVWRVESGRVAIHLLVDEGYQQSEASRALPVLSAEQLDELLRGRARLGSAKWIQHVLAWARERAAES